MALKQWFYLLLPLIVIMTVFLIFLPPMKDPQKILDSAKIKLEGIDNLYLESSVVTDLSIMGVVVRYISNSTVTIIGNQTHSHTIIQQPFDPEPVVSDQFIIDQGRYSCTNNLIKPVCYLDFDIVEYTDDAVNETLYESIEFLGVKKVNGRTCDAILANTNLSLFQGIFPEYEVNEFAKINNATLYSCVDTETGLTLESLWTIVGESEYAGLLVESSINISKVIDKVSFNNTISQFSLPYEVVSEEEYWMLFNQTYEALSQDL